MTDLHNSFEDMKSDDLDFGTNPHKELAKAIADAGVTVYKETCKKCKGSGRYYGFSSHGSHCFDCNGRGFQEYKTSPQHRQARQERKAARKLLQAEQKKADGLKAADSWLAGNPVIADWFKEKMAKDNSFAQSLFQGLQKFGSLTEGQVQAIYKSMAKDVERQQEYEARNQRAETVDIGEIERVFAKAAGTGLRRPKLRLAGFLFSPAPATGKNAGAIYVKQKDPSNPELETTYMGKIQNGKFFPSRDCTPEQQAEIIKVAAKPEDAAITYGRLMGACAVCGKRLDRKDSIERGIGPVCFSKFF